MDLIDKKICCELDNNCRITHSQLAKKLRIARNVVSYRIKRLENQGIITRYICSLRLKKLGFNTFKIYIKTSSVTVDDENRFIEYLSKNKRIIHLIKTEGYYDYSLTTVAKEIKELDSMIMDIKEKFKTIILEYAVSMLVYSRIFKFEKIILARKNDTLKSERYNEELEKKDIDEKDRIILSELSQNANMTIMDIARRTKLSVDIVKYRMKNMRDLVNSYRAIFDLSKLGYYQYTVLIKSKDFTRKHEEKMFAWASMNPFIMFYNKRIGNFDFELTIAIRNIDELNTLLADLKKEFHPNLGHYETILNTKLIKLDYFPF